MRLPLFVKYLSVIFLLFSAHCTNAQSKEPDSISYARSARNAMNLYHQFMSDERGLYNGSQYLIYAQTLQEGIPYFEATDFVKGSVTYDGVFYENVPLLYDEVKDVIVTTIPSSNYSIMLINDKVSSFNLQGHTFTRLVKDSSDKLIKTGFYEILYEGNIMLYKKQSKYLGEDLSTNKLQRFILETNTFYLQKNNTFFTITSKRTLLGVLNDRKKEIQEFIKKNKLDIRKDKDNALSKIAAHYDEISKK